MASFLKRFYRKPPDGLLEICERVYVFDCCFATNAWTEQDYKVHIEGIVGQFRDHFQDSSILVFNFREGEEQSKLAKILSEYEMTIMDYPRQYEGCPLLTMEMIHHFLRSCESWLSLGQHNLLLMHCECGGWPILAFMLAALLIYRKLYSGEQKTLDMVYKQAPRELLHLLLPLNPMPSQLRYLQYVSRRNVATEWPPLDRALTLDCVIIRFIPNFDGDGGCRPIFRIYGQDPFLVNDRSPKVLFSTAKRSKAVRVYKQAESELVKIDINCHIQGDVVLEGINLSEDMEQEQMMFRVMFNTAFIRSNILMLNRDEIDTLWEAKDLFPKNFRIEILFSEMDAAASIVPIDLSCFEEKEGLPIEAFAKVQEIFSQVEWLSPKADAAINMIKQMNASSIFQEISDAKSDHGLESSALSAMKSFRKSLQRSNERIADIRTERRGSLSMDLEGQSILSSEPHWEREEEVAQTAKSAPDYHNSMNDLLTELSEDQTSAHTLAEDGKFQDVTSFERKEVMDLTAVSPDRIKSQLSDEHSDPKSVSILPMAPSPFQHGFSARAALTPPAPPLVLLPSASLNLLGSKPETSPSAEKIHSPSEDKGDSSSAHLLSSTSRHSPPTTPPPPPLPPPQGMQTPASLDKEAVSHLQDTTKGSLASFAAEPLSHSPPPLPDSSFPTLTVQQSSKQPPPPTPLLTDNQPANMTPPRPPPSPPHSNQAVLQSSKPPPPPTPPLNDNQPAKMRPPPPPPPPSSSSQPMSPEVSTAVPPPPAPPAPPMSRQAETISKNSPQVPSAPPPPTPTARGVSRASTGSPSPAPPSLSGLSAAKGRGLSRGTNLKANSTKKLKPLHWLKLSRAVQGSIWAEAQKSGEATKAPEIDMSELETLFSASVPVSDRSRKSSLRSSDGRKPEIVQLIDHRRAYNCEIMLSKVKVPLHELMNSVLSLEDSALDVDQVENLIKFCPTKEEMELLKGYTGDKEKLGRCEQFFLELMQVPRVESKLRVFSFKIQFLTQVADLRKNLNIVNSAAEEIKNSVKLKRVMQTILQLGNALNQGTARGAAIGFRLDSLLKLTDTRARNNKMTLMHYLCKVLADKLPEVIDFSKDLTHLEPASKVQLKFLAEEMQAISKGLEKVMQELSLSDNDGPVSQNFCKILKDFLRFAEAEVRSLASLYSGVGKNVDSLILYFGEDPARCPFEQVVSTLLNFQRMFNKAHEENCKQIEVEMKKAAESDKSKLNASHKDADHSFQTALLTSDVR